MQPWAGFRSGGQNVVSLRQMRVFGGARSIYMRVPRRKPAGGVKSPRYDRPKDGPHEVEARKEEAAREKPFQDCA